jgi:hypothetical protein
VSARFILFLAVFLDTVFSKKKQRLLVQQKSFGWIWILLAIFVYFYGSNKSAVRVGAAASSFFS